MDETGERSFLTVAEAARRLGVNPSTVWRWIKSGRIHANRVGQKGTRISKGELDTFVRPMKEGSRSSTLLGKYVPEPVSEEALARRREAIEWILAHRVSVAPLTTADLIHKVRAERMKHDPPR